MKRTARSKPPALSLRRKLTALRKRRLSVRQIALLYAGCLLATGIAAAAIATISRSPDSIPDPYRSEQRAATSFQLYYPSQLPPGYEIDFGSLGRLEQTIVNLRVRNTAGQELTISQQQRPDGFDFKTFYNSFAERQTESLTLGEVTVGVINNDTVRVASLVTDTTWILVQAPRDIENATVLAILSHFKASQAE